MKKTILGLGLIFLAVGLAPAQKVDSKTSSTVNNSTSANKNGDRIGLESGTQISAQLQNSIDVQKARVGDEVVLKTTKAIKQNGKTVVDKGAVLFGRVTEVQRKTKDNATSRVGILFDRLQPQGGRQLSINTIITSITRVQAQTSMDDTTSSDISGSTSTQTSTQSSNNGGLLGGVGNTVGGIVNATTQTAGKVANKVGKTVNGTTDTVGGTLNNIQISQSTDVSANGGSTLSLPGGNLRLDKGTTFNLSVSESTSVRGN